MSERRIVPGLRTRHPLGLQLPGVYADDDFVQRLTEGLDEVLAPVQAVLDSLPAYFDPRLAPEDLLALLAAWVGAEGEVRGAVRGHASRGTAQGLAEQIHRTFGITPEIEESGGTVWSATARTPLPGTAEPRLTVRLRGPDAATVDVAAVSAFVARNRPVHMPFTVEVIPGSP
ncbi:MULTISPECIES: phage tail protein [Streptomyces]|uniref:Phage tail protein n=1 Tax=Streptomyces solicathayae TaxID=3081768 RepID=A0ABZ0LPM5_9ACTN|nr:phage tail protein [Streptomyces sp. HUAS YS2]WOX21462.1 phage tail protein [Streptomyces sp. HUAS YS2]